MTVQERIDALHPAPRVMDLRYKIMVTALAHERAATEAVQRGGGRVSREWVEASAQWAECRRWIEELAA